MSRSFSEDGRCGVWEFHIKSYTVASRKRGYDTLYPWMGRGSIPDTNSDSMIYSKHSSVALTLCDSTLSVPSSPPWIVVVLSAPNTTIWPVRDHYINGHEAFFSSLELEISDACKGLLAAYRMISAVAMPPVCVSLRMQYF